MMSSVLDSAEYLMLIFQKKIAICSSLVGPQGSWALVHRTTCTTCMAATDVYSMNDSNVRECVIVLQMNAVGTVFYCFTVFSY